MKEELTPNELKKVYEAAALLTQSLSKHITIPELSIMVNLTEKKLQAGFMHLYNSGIYEYLVNARLDYVKEMLLQDLPLKWIALKIGYKDKSTLIKAFRNKYGATPGQWKKQQAKNFFNKGNFN